jgi:hypothetical protein
MYDPHVQGFSLEQVFARRVYPALPTVEPARFAAPARPARGTRRRPAAHPAAKAGRPRHKPGKIHLPSLYYLRTLTQPSPSPTPQTTVRLARSRPVSARPYAMLTL